MKKILIIPLLGIEYEGITSVIYNYINNMNKDGLIINFTTFDKTELKLMNIFNGIGEVYRIPERKKFVFSYIKALYMLLKNRYDVVHIHGNSGTMLIETILAKMSGVKKIIVHCHSTACNHPIINRILTPIMKCIATDFIACSNASGKWLYKKNFIVLNNAIDLEKFQYNNLVRQKYRQELGIKNEFVIGHVGTFNESKNHEFLIEVFKEIYKLDSKIKLLLIGGGPLFEDIKNKIYEFNLKDSVIFLGSRDDVENLYQVMDCFVFPSKWEGLGVVLIEAQASVLPCFVSTSVPKDAKVTDLIQYLSLKESSKVWAEKILDVHADFREEKKDVVIEQITNSGYEIKNNACILKEIYMR